MKLKLFPAFIFAIWLGATASPVATSPWLWQIGNDDGQYREFALAAGKLDDYRNDPVFLVGASNRDQRAKLIWRKPVPMSQWLSGTDEKPRSPINSEISVPAGELVTIRAERSGN